MSRTHRRTSTLSFVRIISLLFPCLGHTDVHQRLALSESSPLPGVSDTQTYINARPCKNNLPFPASRPHIHQHAASSESSPLSHASDIQTCIKTWPCWFGVALRPRRRDGLLGTGTEWEGGERAKGSTAETARKRPERPWTAARTMEVLRRCPLAIAQRLVHCAIALSTAVLDRVTKTMSVAPLLTNNLDHSKQKTSNLLSPAPPPYS